ncbi:MAG: hypothetical protein IVW54_17445 [Candidatus Binataceae bacterium]|nr:hypothetical protein [Candidatus Binataceae bacterium]
MQYILLIYHNESQALSGEERGKLFQEYGAFTQDIVKAGKFKAGDPLQPSSTATTVRVRNGKTARAAAETFWRGWATRSRSRRVIVERKIWHSWAARAG